MGCGILSSDLAPRRRSSCRTPVESALSGVMKHSDRLTYRRTFEVPRAWARQRVLLHFGAVDWEAKVSINGQELGTHRGGYDGFSFDLTDALKRSEEHTSELQSLRHL